MKRVKVLKELHLEGNKGGDVIEIVQRSNHEDNMVSLTVGRCCVYHIDMEVPVEVLVAILINALDNGPFDSDIVEYMDDSVKQKLLSQMKNNRISKP